MTTQTLFAIKYVALYNYANNLDLCGHTDWSLPNVNELESLINAEQDNNATWLIGQGFSDMRTDSPYWTSTTFGVGAMTAQMRYGDLPPQDKAASAYVLPVRSSGQSGTVQLPKTGQTIMYSTGDDGDLEIGASWPSPRFTVGTGAQADCVTDNLTGLMWTKNANPPAATKLWSDALIYSNSLDLCGYTDWRLPNRKELRSLIDYSYPSNSLPAGHPFTDVQSLYWASTTQAHSSYTFNAWYLHMPYGMIDDTVKNSNSFGVWPVRSGAIPAPQDNIKNTRTGTTYSTLQSAYNASITDDTLQSETGLS